MRLIKSLLALCFVVLGIVFGALNTQRVHVDLWFDAVDGRLGLVLLTVLLLGALVGSFLNVVIWRVPRGESVVHPASRCPSCGAAIRPRPAPWSPRPSVMSGARARTSWIESPRR